MHLSKVMMCIQRCNKVWSYYNRLSFGPLEGLPVTRNPWCITEGHRIFYSPSFPLCLCLNFTHSGDRCLEFSAQKYVSSCFCVFPYISLSAWNLIFTFPWMAGCPPRLFSVCSSRAYLWTTSMGFLLSASGWVWPFRRQQWKWGWGWGGERDWLYKLSFYYDNTV